MKKVYFVRHGESESNAGDIYRGGESPLTPKGFEQAILISKNVESLGIDTLISSTYTRAKQTAEVIAKKIHLPIEYSDKLIERKRVTEQLNVSRRDERFIEIDTEITAYFTKEGYRHSDEENFDDLKNRAKNALTFLQEQKGDVLLVVTHEVFMRVILAYATFGEDLTAKECQQFILTYFMNNTGLSYFTYNETNKAKPWVVWSWNDHNHLG